MATLWGLPCMRGWIMVSWWLTEEELPSLVTCKGGVIMLEEPHTWSCHTGAKHGGVCLFGRLTPFLIQVEESRMRSYQFQDYATCNLGLRDTYLNHNALIGWITCFPTTWYVTSMWISCDAVHLYFLLYRIHDTCFFGYVVHNIGITQCVNRMWLTSSHFFWSFRPYPYLPSLRFG